MPVPLRLLTPLLLLTACGVEAAGEGIHTIRGQAMGSSWTVKWCGDADPAAVAEAVRAELDLADRTFSTWQQDSELARFNRHRDTAPLAASPLLCSAVALSLQLAQWTGGAFDPTVRPLSDLYRQAKAGNKAAFAEAAVAAAHKRVGWQRVAVRDGWLAKTVVDVELDLDGIVAGLCADRIGERLRALAVRDYLLDITGEMLGHGRKPDGSPWRVGIVDPQRSEPGHEGLLVELPLRERALCTSGGYRNFQVDGDRVRTHIFDPRTGNNPDNGVVSVSVLARSCALADGLGTALMVLGPAGAAAAIARCPEPDAAAWFVLAGPAGAMRNEQVGWPEAFRLDGEPPRGAQLGDEDRTQREADLQAAQAALAKAPNDVEAIVWYGRRLAYLGRFRDAIAAYSDGLQKFPYEPRLLRHRGHRYLTVRDFPAAVADLERAAMLVRNKPDEVEPDGQPVEGRPPHSTLHYNIHYHHGLARFLVGEFAAAEAAWRECLLVANNDEARVAVSHWLWCACMRQGRKAAAAAAVASIEAQLDVVENRSYHQLCLLYRGELAVTDLEPRPGSSGAALAFGLAHYVLVLGDERGARARFEALASSPEWTSFGAIAAEAELARLPPEGR